MINYFRLLLISYFFCASCFSADNTAIPARDPFLPDTAHLQTITQPNSQLLPMRSSWIPLYFAKTDDVVSFLSNKQNHILSANGKVSGDKRNNQIWLYDDSKHSKIIRNIIWHLDKPSTQFLIKAKIINIDHQYQKSLGVLFRDDNSNEKPEKGLPTETSATPSGVGELTVTIAKLAGNHLLNLQLSALEQQGHASLISSPALITLNNKPAVIESGSEVPYQKSTSSGATSVSFKKAVLRLQVTPRQMPNHRILLHIALNQDKVSALTVNGVPAIETQQLTTQVVVRDHETIVLGGILETIHAKQDQGVPIADQIPVVGELFRHHTRKTTQEELLIFITPSMMKKVY